MTLFLGLAAALLLLVLLLLLLPLWRGGEGVTIDRQEQNVAIARERLRELRSQLEAGEIDQGEYEEGRRELEARLGADLAGAEATQADAGSLRGRWLALPLLLLVPLLAASIYLALGKPAAIGGGSALQATGHEALDPEEMVARLAARLQQEPENAKGWAMLGRSYMALGRFPEAASAFGRLRELVGDDPQVLLRLADALAMSQKRISGQPARLLRQVLRQDPDNVEALWMLGLAQAEKGRYREALELWSRAEQQLSEQPDELQELRRLMQEARARLRAAGEPDAGNTGVRAGGRQQAASSSGVAIPVQVSLSPELEGAAPPGATLYVLARAVDGPPMPLAVARRKVTELPLTLQLNDSMAMMPQMRISAFPRVRIEARVSLSGQAKPGPGDLQAEPVEVDTASPAPVKLVIDERRP